MKKLIILPFALITIVACGRGLDIPELTEKVVQALKVSDIDSLLDLTFTVSDFEYFAQNEGRCYNREDIVYEVQQEKENIRYRYKVLKNSFSEENPDWDKAMIERIIYEPESVDGNRFCAILVELLCNDRKYYLEIEVIEAENGWKIHDDIMMVGRDIEERIRNNNKRMTLN